MFDLICLWIGRVFVAASTLACLSYAIGEIAFYTYKSFVEWELLVEFFAWKKQQSKGKAARDKRNVTVRDCSTCRYVANGSNPEGCSSECFEPEFSDYEPDDSNEVSR